MPRGINRRTALKTGGATLVALTPGLSGCLNLVSGGSKQKFVVSSKNFTEQFVLSNISAVLLKENGYTVASKMGLGGSPANFKALKNDESDLYWEYTGTAWSSILDQERKVSDPQRLYELVDQKYNEQFDIDWLKYAPFNNTYVIMANPAWAKEHGLKTLEDLADYVNAGNTDFSVAMNPVVPCNACSACKRGDTHLCQNNTSIGGAGETIVDGAFAEYVRVPAINVEDVGDLPFEQAALAEPLACCVHGADRSGVEQGDSVALVGAGPIGLMLLQTLRNRGSAPIAVSELDPDRRELARQLGADIVVDPTQRDPVEVVREEIGLVDAGIEVVGKVTTIQQAHQMTTKGGNTLIFGVPDQDATMEISPFDIYFEEIDVRGTYALNQESFERAVTLLREGRIDAEALVSEEIGLDEIPSAFDRMANAEGLKKLVIPGRRE